MVDEKMEPSVCKEILYGESDPLNSSYRVSYNMLLNLMRVEDVDPEYLLRASFHQFQREKDAPGLLAQADELQAEADDIKFDSPDEEEIINEYYQMDQQLLAARRSISKYIRKPEHILRYLQTGRLLDVNIDGDMYGWGVVVSCRKKPGTGAGGDAGQLAAFAVGPEYTLEILLNCVDRHFDSNEGKGKDEDAEHVGLVWKGSSISCRPVKDGDNKKIVSMRIFVIELENIERISAIKLHCPQDVKTPEARRLLSTSVAEVKKRMKNQLPLLDPVNDMNISSADFLTYLERAETLSVHLASHKLSVDFTEQDRLRLLQTFRNKTELLHKAKLLRDEARSCQTMAMKDDLKKMKRVLKRLGHVDASGVIQTKGRTACEVNTAHELVVVEMLFAGVFNELSVEQCVALLSCMTYDERNADEDNPTAGMKSYLANPFRKLQEIARTVVRVEIACGIEVNEDEFLQKFNPGM
jgi:ATP-dependent RNA helicase DOB1